MNKTFAAGCLAAALLAPTAWAQTCPSWPTAERFTINGAEVTDTRTGLTWKRCSDGQTWSGSTCTGSATTHTHEVALALAQAATGWRLPNVKELASLADEGCQNPAIDSTAFPNTPSNWYWSSSGNAVYSGIAWLVNFGNGSVGTSINRSNKFRVRLVRASQSLLAPTARAQTCPSGPTAERFAINGAEVTDTRTGLTWKRCSEGQTWSGSTCTGSATIHTHGGALALAQAATGWRLPNVKELASLADKGCQNPAIDSTAFPNTPSKWYWSSSPDVGYSGLAWYVDFGNGYFNYYGFPNVGSHVRLVRASQ